MVALIFAMVIGYSRQDLEQKFRVVGGCIDLVPIRLVIALGEGQDPVLSQNPLTNTSSDGLAVESGRSPSYGAARDS